MFIELCVRNYAIHDGLFNGANGIFKCVKSFPKNESFIWIQILNSKVGTNTQGQNQRLYSAKLKHLSNPSPKKSK
jgi:hypothetical protein